MQRPLEDARNDVLMMPVGLCRPPPQRIRFRCEDARQLIEKLLHVRRERRTQLVERTLQLATKRRSRQRFEQRSAEVQRAQLRQRQPSRKPLECLSVHHPSRPPIVARAVVIDRKPRLLERLQIAADRPRRDAAEARQIVDRHAGTPGAFDLFQNRPLTDDFGVARHVYL